MRKLPFALLLFLSVFTFSCSSSDDDNDGNEPTTISDNPVSGQLYGEAFTMDGGKAVLREVFDVQSVEIHLTAEDLGCETLGFSDFPITITAPAAVGVHTTDVYASFEDPNSSDYISLSGGITIEIISLGNTVVGKVLAASTSTESNINGKFDVEICQD